MPTSRFRNRGADHDLDTPAGLMSAALATLGRHALVTFLDVSPRAVQHWAAGSRRVPVNVLRKTREALEAHSRDALSLARSFTRHLTAIADPTEGTR